VIHKNLSPLHYGRKLTSRTPPQAQMSVVVRGTWRLTPGERELTLIEDPLEQGFLSADVVADDDLDRVGPISYASDFADFKPRAEVLLKGSAYAPGGSDTLAAATVSLETWSKTVLAIGPRVWNPGFLFGASFSEPVPFESIPLTWENAFGGRGERRNPVGRGLEETLPLTELPRSLIKTLGDRPQPATFLPINPLWSPRKQKRGRRYGAKWRVERAPFYSSDFDWSYFNAAPEDQWLPGYIQGDEELTLENLDPSHRRWTVQLPGVRVRHFVRTRSGTDLEVPMNCDTLFVDLETMRVYISWRGLVDVEEPDFTDIPAALSVLEPLAESLPAEHYFEQMRAVESDPLGLATLLPPDLLPLFAVAAAEELNLQREIQNLPPLPIPVFPEPDLPAPSDAVSGQVRDALGGARPDVQKRLADAMATARQAYDSIADDPKLPKPSFDELLVPPSGGQPPAPLPRPSGAAAPGVVPHLDLRAMAASVTAVRDAITKAGGGQEVSLKGLDEIEDKVAEVVAEQGGSVPPPGQDLSGQDLRERDFSAQDLEGATFANSQLQGVSFRDAKLRGAVFSGAELEGADFGGADLGYSLFESSSAPHASFVGANLDGAQLPQAELRGANFRGASLIQAQLPETTLDDADFSEADLSQATLGKASAARTKFRGAKLDMTNLNEATLPASDFSGAKGELALLMETDLRQAIFHGASLVRSDFQKSDLSKADFSQATLEWSSFRTVKAHGVRMTGAKLYMFVASRRADFTGAELRGMQADESIWINSILDGADFSFSSMKKAQLQGARADGASFKAADLKEAGMRRFRCRKGSFVAANLCRTVLELGDLSGSELLGANCYETVLLNTNLEGCDADGANLDHAMLDQR